ncbi:stage II sporulation protein M [Candidatus Woesearchaeota archaeon]|nr:stage II sporulation protein M [Candidatus Woesearchaeota archaeon]
MVLEGLIEPFKAEKRPFEMFFLGILFSSVAIVLGLFVFSPYSSIVCIALTALVCVPIVYGVLKLEEKNSLQIMKEYLLVKAHGRAVLFFLFLFLGFVVSFTLWYLFLPDAYLNEVFLAQSSTIAGISGTEATGAVVGPAEEVLELVLHNSKVLLFCLFFAFFYGFGAIFILTWNASVIGAAIGDTIRSTISSGFFSSISSSIMRYMTHGIPEVVGYFTAGIAGGIISVAVINHDWNSPHFRNIIKDSTDLILISLACITVAAVLEVFVSPHI